MGIPAIIGVGDQVKEEYEGREVIVDGGTGNIVIDADADTRDYMIQKRKEQLRKLELLNQLKSLPNVTKDGQEIRVYCNIGNPEDVHAVLGNDGGGPFLGIFNSPTSYTFCIIIKIATTNNNIAIYVGCNNLCNIGNFMYNALFVYHPISSFKLWFILASFCRISKILLALLFKQVFMQSFCCFLRCVTVPFVSDFFLGYLK
jgi:hypothetical protein